MTDTLDQPATSSASSYGPSSNPRREHPNRLNQAAAWVAIVAGVVFVVGAVFFTGYFLGRQSGYAGGWGHHARVDRVNGTMPMPPAGMMPMPPAGMMPMPPAGMMPPPAPGGPPAKP